METICEAEVDTGEVVLQLDRILRDKRFAGAERTARFLRYVVERTLEGAASQIKEMVIATDLYGRSSDYDPKIDSMVRVEATRLRTKLQSYYAEQGYRDPVSIIIPKGSYVPRFEWRDVADPEFVEDRQSMDLEILEVSNAMPEQPLLVDGQRRRLRETTPWAATIVALGIAVVCFFTGSAAWTRSVVASPAAKQMTDISPEALAAWDEGKALLQQDPHSGSSEHGAPQMLLRSIERFEFAVARAPSFANAWASLAEAYEYAFPYVGRDSTADAAHAEAAARRAIALDGNSATAHASLALVLFYLRWDLAAAEAEYRRAIALDGRLPYAVVEYVDLLRETGRLEQAEVELRKARTYLPALPVLVSKQAEIELDGHQVESAIATASYAVRLKRDYGRAYVVLGMAYQAKGSAADALEQYRAALAIDREDRRALPSLGYWLAINGREAEARVVLQQLIRMNAEVRNCAFQIAVVYAGLGSQGKALDWLETAYKTRQMHVPFMSVEPRFQTLRSSPRFRALLSRLGLHYSYSPPIGSSSVS